VTPAELKAARRRLGFRSRRTLAEALGVTKWAVDSWELGRRPIPGWLPKFLALWEKAQGAP
jgi:DNA-binding transcriptional regulator YiaG